MFNSMFFPEFILFFLCHILCFAFAYSSKHVLHFSRGLKDHKNFSLTFPCFRKSVRNHSRAKNSISCLCMKALFTYLKDKLPLQNVPIFVLVKMIMQRRAAFLHTTGLKKKQITCRVIC